MIISSQYFHRWHIQDDCVLLTFPKHESESDIAMYSFVREWVKHKVKILRCRVTELKYPERCWHDRVMWSIWMIYYRMAREVSTSTHCEKVKTMTQETKIQSLFLLFPCVTSAISLLECLPLHSQKLLLHMTHETLARPPHPVSMTTLKACQNAEREKKSLIS